MDVNPIPVMKGCYMKTTLITLLAAAGLVSAASAAACPEADFDGCTGTAYSIVETEAVEYWPHNQMESAHAYQIDGLAEAPRRHYIHLHACR